MPQPHSSLSGRRVLVAEDEVFLADELQASLLERGAQVVGPAYSVRGAFALLSEPFDFAILDLSLDGESILPLADTLKAMNVPFYFSSGYEDALLPPSYRGIPIWVKPFDPEALLDDLALRGSVTTVEEAGSYAVGAA